MSMSNDESNKERILWSSIARDNVILVEAGHDTLGGAVAETAQQLLQRQKTPGWEFHSQSLTAGILRAVPAAVTAAAWPRNRGGSRPSGRAAPQQHQQHQHGLKGIKFHLYETVAAEQATTTTTTVTGTITPIPPPPHTRIWVFSAVYDPALIDRLSVQSFIEKMIGISQLFRETDDTWKYGSTLACQAQFAAILHQRMAQVTSLGKQAAVHEQLQTTRAIMAANIQQILQNEQQAHELAEQASRLQEMAHVFKKRTVAIRRAKMMQNAKHGLILGTVITAGVAIVVVPPLVALL
jgi:tetrahydromethanopterin S-methyltransferase subunit B